MLRRSIKLKGVQVDILKVVRAFSKLKPNKNASKLKKRYDRYGNCSIFKFTYILELLLEYLIHKLGFL